MTITVDIASHVIEAVAIVAGAWKVNRAVNRILDALENFPPHRHVNGNILYPKDFEPTDVGILGINAHP